MDVMRRPDINGPWRVWRRKAVRLAVSLLLVLSLAVSGGVWWYRRTHPAGPAEPMCLLSLSHQQDPRIGQGRRDDAGGSRRRRSVRPRARRPRAAPIPSRSTALIPAPEPPFLVRKAH